MLLLLFAPLLHAVPGAPECRPVREVEGEFVGSEEFSRGLLWKINKDGNESNYIFGTIHVADDRIVALPDPVKSALDGSRSFVMEVVPDLAQILALSALMFYDDGTSLNQFLSDALFRRTVEILSSYHLPEEAVATMKPWAAFLTMSYPSDMRPVLDLQLLQHASEKGLQSHGLETLEEQGSIFNGLEFDEQLRLLMDTVCHYDVISADFESLKKFYLERDLKGLYLFSQRHAFSDNSLYERLTQRLLTDRNRIMTERMLPHLEKGSAFVAIGAMHLPGSEGVLESLASRGYEVTRVY
ncbi:MAG: TraB/GumN family protein [Gammaproteobacteria bacterium]